MIILFQVQPDSEIYKEDIVVIGCPMGIADMRKMD